MKYEKLKTKWTEVESDLKIFIYLHDKFVKSIVLMPNIDGHVKGYVDGQYIF